MNTPLSIGLSLILLVTLVMTNNTSHAEEFWGHQFATTTDLKYGKHKQQKLDRFMYGERVGEPQYFEIAANPNPTLMWIHDISHNKMAVLMMFHTI